MESGDQQGWPSPPPTPPPLQAQQGEVHLAGRYHFTNPAGGRFLLPPNSPPFLYKRAVLSFVLPPCWLTCLCNSLLFPNKPIFAGKMTGSFIFKVNTIIFKKEGAEADRGKGLGVKIGPCKIKDPKAQTHSSFHHLQPESPVLSIQLIVKYSLNPHVATY